MRVGCLFYVSLSGKLGEKLEKCEDCSKRKKRGSKQFWGKVVKSGKSPKLKNTD